MTVTTKIDAAIAAWEAKGPTSLTVALMAEALYEVRRVCEQVEANPVGWGGPSVVSLARTLCASVVTHHLNHAPLPEGVLLDLGYCAGCDAIRQAGMCKCPFNLAKPYEYIVCPVHDEREARA